MNIAKKICIFVTVSLFTIAAAEPVVDVLANPDEKACIPSEKWSKEYSKIDKRILSKLNVYVSKKDGGIERIVAESSSLFSGPSMHFQSSFNISSKKLDYSIRTSTAYETSSIVENNPYDHNGEIYVSSGNGVEKVKARIETLSYPCYSRKQIGQLTQLGYWCPHRFDLIYDLTGSQVEFLSKSRDGPIWLRVTNKDGLLAPCGFLLTTQEIKAVVKAMETKLKALGLNSVVASRSVGKDGA